jgi:hypothetical protein
MSFLLGPLASIAGGLISKALHLREGGVIHIKGKKHNGALAVVHDGEMVVPKKHVKRVKKMMHEDHMNVPKPKVAKSLEAHKKEVHHKVKAVHHKVKKHIESKEKSPKPRARRHKK